MKMTRRLFLAALGAAGVASSLARAEDLPHPLVVYDDELKNGFQNWSWAKAQLSVPVGNGKPIRVEGDAWSALALHHDPFSTAGYSKLVFTINGGTVGGQNLMVKTMANGKIIEADYVIQPKAKTWAVVEVPLKDINAANQTIDAVVWQGQAAAYPPFYITRIQFE
jgi:hypothetical protein